MLSGYQDAVYTEFCHMKACLKLTGSTPTTIPEHESAGGVIPPTGSMIYSILSGKLNLLCTNIVATSFVHSRYFYISSSTPLLLRGASDYSIDTVLELTRQSATGNCE